MSSRLIPSESRGDIYNCFDDLFSILCVKTDRYSVDTTEFFKRTAFPSITGIAARALILPRPSTALPSETTATVLDFIV